MPSTKPLISLVSMTHRKKDVVTFVFPYTTEIINVMRAYQECCWSKTLKCWYILDDRKVLRAIYDQLKAKGYSIDSSKVSRKSEMSQHNLIVCEQYKSYLGGLRYSKSTIATYLSFITFYGKFLKEIHIEKSSEKDMRAFIEYKVTQLNFSISTHRQLISAFTHLKGLFPHLEIPVHNMKRPKRDQFKPVVLSIEEVIKLLQVTQNLKHRFIIAMLYSCGLRINELLSMHLNALDIDRQQVHVKNSKGRKDRYVSLAHHLEALINNYLTSYKPTTYLITGSKEQPYSASSVRAFLKRSCKQAGITKKVTPHTLRHSYATHMLENGVSLRHIQDLLGHCKPETTMLYTHIARKDLLKIENPLDVAVEKFKNAKRHTKPRIS